MTEANCPRCKRELEPVANRRGEQIAWLCEACGAPRPAPSDRAAVDYDFCPKCRGWFSFRKAVSGVCPWCGYHLPNAEHHARPERT